MKWALVLDGVGLALAFGAGAWFARRPREAALPDRAASVFPASWSSSFWSPGVSGPVDQTLSDAEIDALPPELPVAPARRRTAPPVTRFKV